MVTVKLDVNSVCVCVYLFFFSLFIVREPGTIAHPTKLSNGTIPKGIAKSQDSEDLKEHAKDQKDQKDASEKQQSCLDEPNLLVSLFYLFFSFLPYRI